MARFLKNTKKKAGLPPGTVLYTGKQKVKEQSYSVIDYTPDQFSEKTLNDIKEAFPYKDKNSTTWIDIVGLHDTKTIELLGEHYGIHPLVLEDVVNLGQRPSLEEFDDYLFLTFKMLFLNKNGLELENVSIIIAENNVLSFQEKPGDTFGAVRERVKAGRWRSKKRKADYLGYALLDATVDNYFVILEELGDRIELLETELHQELDPKILSRIHKVKHDLIFMRKAVWPLREVVNKLQKSESNIIEKQTRPYLADLYDHTIQIIDTIESYRDIVGGLLDYHLSATSNRMNEIMKVLTIFAAIFIPLTFLAGIYGMNFDVLPELHWKYSYFVLWGIFLLVGGSMLYYFRKKKWL